MMTVSTFLSSDGVHQVHQQTWLPESGSPRGVVLLVHGMSEHISRYDGFARFLNEKGMAVAGHDQLGHGHTAANAEELGYMCQGNPCQAMVDDIHKLRQGIEKVYPGLPVFILGHSMGSFLVRTYLCQFGEGLKGAVIMGTGDTPPVMASMALFMTRSEAGIRGWHYRSRILQNIVIGGNQYKAFNMDGTQPEKSWLTKDADVVCRYYSDPFCAFNFTLNGFEALFSAVLYAAQEKNLIHVPVELPLYFVSGDQDPVGSMGEGVRRAAEKYRKAGMTHVDMHLFSGDRHEILNETDRDQVYEDIWSWLRKQMEN